MGSTLRFFRQFLRPRHGAIVREDTTYVRDGEPLDATLYRPARAGAGTTLPGWVALHGLTASGREHPSLDRLARALAASGSVVLVPDLPEWRALRVAPGSTVATVKAAVLALDESRWTAPGRIGVLGFSFGATQSLVASTDPSLRGHLAGVAAWGGYQDIGRATRFAFLGDHELDGRHYHLDPDPYGRWILTGNYLTLLPEHREDEALADALRGLALEAGRRGIMSWDPATDPLKAGARAELNDRQRRLFDLVAPPAGRSYTPEEAARIRELVDRMVAAAMEHEPLLDPGGHLGRVPVPVVLAHGREDRLMPWTEMVRLERALPPGRLAHSAITGLFSHSFGERRWPTPGLIVDVVRFVRLMRRMLAMI